MTSDMPSGTEDDLREMEVYCLSDGDEFSNEEIIILRKYIYSLKNKSISEAANILRGISEYKIIESNNSYCREVVLELQELRIKSEIREILSNPNFR